MPSQLFCYSIGGYMEKLIEKAKEFLDRNYNINEIELADGVSSVRLVRNSPVIQYYQPQDTCCYHSPNYPRNY